MYVRTINIYILFIGLLFSGSVLKTSIGKSVDPCEDDSERHLHDMHRRFKNYKTMFQRRHEEMVCDKYLIPQHGAWFMSYNDMPTVPPTFLDCGTTHPIWLNGTIPTISEGVVDRTACKVGFMSYCDEEIPVRIKRCEKYTAYFLLPTKHCPEAYCFGIKKDPPLPQPVVKPSIYNENESRVDRLQFECYLNISSLNFAYYEVTWKWGTSSLTLKNESSQFSSLRLTDEHFKTLGVHITCTMKALHFEHDVLGLSATSNKFYAGLKFPEQIITIQKGEVVVIPYQLTVPLSCQMDTCGINVNVILKGTTKLNTCDGQLYAILRENNTIDLMPNDWNSTHNIEMKHIGRKGYGVKPSTFTVEIQVDLSNSNFIHHEHIPELHVHVQDSDSNRKVCSAYNDPHMKTFDGLSYEHQQAGTYILYEHNILERHMQVQMELTPCNSNVAYCICGLAVRAGGDIFVIYLCGGKTIIKYGTCYDKILKVKRAKKTTKQYKITFPTGTEISANIFLHGGYGGTMNVEVRGSGDDKGHTQGLCGRMTGDTADNMLIRGTNTTDNSGGSWRRYQAFSDSWRVKDSENLFHWPDNNSVDKWMDFKLNPETSNVLTCENDNSYETVQPALCGGNYSLSIPVIVNKTLPTSSPGTHVTFNTVQAQEFCKRKIQETNAYRECAAGLPGIDWPHFYDMCWHDIELTDSTMWAKQTVHAVLERCVVEVKNKDKEESHNTSTVNPIKLPDLDKLCPEDCNDHGTCNNAICTCNHQFLGVDCSISVTTPPTITEISGLKSGGHIWCDHNKAKCYSFVLYGHEIEHSGTLTCKIEKYLAMSNSTVINLSTHVVNATVESLSEVHCSLTNRQTLEVTFNHTGLYVVEYRVALSYNNLNYGHHLTLRVFNGECQDIYHPNTNNGVGLMKNTCFINGRCEGVNNTHNDFMVCNPDIDPLKWTFDSKHNCKINGTFYHHKHKNAALQCLSCNPEVSSTNWTLVGECLINGVCYTDLSKSSIDEMYICNSSYSTSEWSMNQTIPVPDIRIHVSPNSLNEEYELECHLDTRRMNYTHFNITWLWGNNSQVFQDTPDNLHLMRLSGYSITDLGINVSCRIEGQYQLNKVATTFRSNEFYVGIKTNSPVEIEKGGTAKLRYWLTVPLSCSNCSFHLTIRDTVAFGVANYNGCNGDIVTLTRGNGCDFETNNANWNASKTLSIKHRPNRQYGVQLDTFLITLEAVVSENIWTVLEVPDIKVKVVQHYTEWHSKVCSAYSDPHMTTFDGLHYEHQYKGKYTMYRNKQRNMEVQIQLTSCYNDNVFCACGIAVRAGADVFIINFCDGWSVIQYVACEHSPVLQVSKMKQNNQHYRITFPTGTSINVRIARVNPVNFLDIEIRPSADDFNNTDGLCGTLTNSCDDDFPLRNGNSKSTATSCHNRLYSLANLEFSNSWKVSSGIDLFSLHEKNKLSLWTNTENYCKCTSRENGKSNDKCGNSLFPSVYCTDSGFEPIETTCRNNALAGTYTIAIPKIKGENHITKPGNAFIREYNKTMNESLKYCKKELVSKDAFQLCSQIDNIPSQHFEEICAIDIHLSHTLIWIAQTYETMISRCIHELHLNPVLQTSHTKEGQSFTEIMRHKLCPGFTRQCSRNGACRNGICVCDHGFMSPDCSISISTVPTVDHIQNHGLCDMSKEACRTVQVYGRIIYEVKMMFCRIQTFYMFEDKSFQYGSVNIVTGKINSLVEIRCNISAELLIEQKFTSYIARGVTVSVGHNGHLFSTKSFKYFEFEPKCQIPRGTEADRFFEIANGTCFVNGRCYNDMEFNPINIFEYCDSKIKQQEWSFNKTSVCKIDGIYVPKSNLTSNSECQSCNPEKSVYNWTVVDNECFINYTCYSNNDRNPKHADEYCDPLNSQIRWTFNESVLVPDVRPALLKVHQTIMNVDVERLYFECAMELNRLFYKIYEVTWTWGSNQSLILESDVHNMQNLWLTETHFQTLGTNISCTLRGKHSNEDQDGTVFSSEPFFAGIYITELMTVEKGGSADLSYNLTVPFGCLSFNNRTLPCFIELNMLSPDYTTSDQCYGDIVNLEHCRVKIWRDSWSTPRKLAIKHRGRQMYGVFPEKISMKLKTSSADHPLWDTTKIPEIKVHVHDSKVELQDRVCSAYNVHITTFDGLHYVQPNQGTFTLYNNRLKERNMMVQVKLTQCDDISGVHCICGVAVRAGGDVYVFDFCDGKSIIQYMSCQQKLLDVTTRSKDNKKYKITFPTGTEVAVNIQYIGANTFMNVEIRASETDFNMTEGLCGTLNDQCVDDLAETDGKFSPVKCNSNEILNTISQQFSDFWRVSSSNDLFNISNGAPIALWTDHDEYCSCPSAEISDKFECSARAIVPCNRKNDYKTIGQLTCKLSPIDNFNLHTKNRTHQNPTTFKPELVNITVLDAQSLCRKAIENNTAFKACSVVPNMPSEYFIHMCGFEVAKSKSVDWIRHTVDSMKSRCLSEVQKNETLDDQPSEDIPSITETVIMAICPGLPECSGNGKCDHGLCVCNDGFMSHDCSMTKTVPPEIYGVRGNGICDRNEINCDTAFVVGNRIEESDDLSCRISKYVIHPDGSKSFEGTTIVRGNVETLVEVHCPLKTTKQKRSVRNTGSISFVEVFDVSVSYNMEDFSDPERVILMNSKCQQNNGTITELNFVLKDDTCFIDNQCLLDQEPNSQQEYLYCNAQTDRYRWTFDDSKYCKVEEQYFSSNNMIFDKECLFCNPDFTPYNWTLKENYCLIDGDCVSHDQKNTVDECLFCNTENNLFEWTKHDEVCITKVDKPSNAEKSSSKLGLILLGSIGSVVILFIVGFIVNCYVKNNNSRLKRKSTYEADDHYAMRRLPRMKVNN